MNSTIYTVFILSIYALIFGMVIFFAVKKTRLFLILLGIGFIIAAIPIGLLAEIQMAGCCGATNNNLRGVGFLIGFGMGTMGIILIIFACRIKG